MREKNTDPIQLELWKFIIPLVFHTWNLNKPERKRKKKEKQDIWSHFHGPPLGHSDIHTEKFCDTWFPSGTIFMLLRTTSLGFVCSSGFVDLLLFHFGESRAIGSNFIKLWEYMKSENYYSKGWKIPMMSSCRPRGTSGRFFPSTDFSSSLSYWLSDVSRDGASTTSFPAQFSSHNSCCQNVSWRLVQMFLAWKWKLFSLSRSCASPVRTSTPPFWDFLFCFLSLEAATAVDGQETYKGKGSNQASGF